MKKKTLVTGAALVAVAGIAGAYIYKKATRQKSIKKEELKAEEAAQTLYLGELKCNSYEYLDADIYSELDTDETGEAFLLNKGDEIFFHFYNDDWVVMQVARNNNLYPVYIQETDVKLIQPI